MDKRANGHGGDLRGGTARTPLQQSLQLIVPVTLFQMQASIMHQTPNRNDPSVMKMLIISHPLNMIRDVAVLSPVEPRPADATILLWRPSRAIKHYNVSNGSAHGTFSICIRLLAAQEKRHGGAARPASQRVIRGLVRHRSK